MTLLIPFILHFEAGLPISKCALPFPEIFEHAKKTGFANDPSDSGGATLCGVTLATYRTYCRNRGLPVPSVTSLKQMPPQHWRDILKTLFWDRWRADEISSPAIAAILVDWVWGSGIHGIKRPQRLLGVTPDGIVGPKTLRALNHRISTDPTLFETLIADRIKFVRDIVARRPAQKKFLKGWERRILALRHLK